MASEAVILYRGVGFAETNCSEDAKRVRSLIRDKVQRRAKVGIAEQYQDDDIETCDFDKDGRGKRMSQLLRTLVMPSEKFKENFPDRKGQTCQIGTIWGLN
jgi:hypothetical protein